MTVYVVERGYDYEGSEVMGVYGAIGHAEAYARTFANDATPIREETRRGSGLQLSFGYFQISVTPWAVWS